MTNFEKVTESTARLATEINLRGKCDWCIYKEGVPCKPSDNLQCLEGIMLWLDEEGAISLTVPEREICVGLKHMGLKYIARDQNGRLFAFPKKPKREEAVWNVCGYNATRINTTHYAFKFITWGDDEPTSVDSLL